MTNAGTMRRAQGGRHDTTKAGTDDTTKAGMNADQMTQQAPNDQHARHNKGPDDTTKARMTRRKPGRHDEGAHDTTQRRDDTATTHRRRHHPPNPGTRHVKYPESRTAQMTRQKRRRRNPGDGMTRPRWAASG
jgi:hypothetical protein